MDMPLKTLSTGPGPVIQASWEAETGEGKSKPSLGKSTKPYLKRTGGAAQVVEH
jgi:hypothetical protein